MFTVVLIPGGFDDWSPLCPSSVSQGSALLQGWVLLSSSLIFFLKNKDWNFTGPAPLLDVLSPQDPRPSAHPGVCRACKGEGLLESVDPPPRLAPSDTVI